MPTNYHLKFIRKEIGQEEKKMIRRTSDTRRKIKGVYKGYLSTTLSNKELQKIRINRQEEKINIKQQQRG